MIQSAKMEDVFRYVKAHQKPTVLHPGKMVSVESYRDICNYLHILQYFFSIKRLDDTSYKFWREIFHVKQTSLHILAW